MKQTDGNQQYFNDFCSRSFFFACLIWISSMELQLVLRAMKTTACGVNLSEFDKQKSKSSSHIMINERFCLKSLKEKHNSYNFYKGVDITKAKWVHIYIKQVQSDNNFLLSKGVKEHLRNQISPRIFWTGQTQVDKCEYFVEVHEKFGPSLQNVFDKINAPPNERQILHLLLEMIRLVEKMYSLKLVSGELDPNSIVFDPNPKKNELYLLNCFSIKKKNTQIKPIFTKYCSRGVHLGRSIGVKDDLESVCYILIDLFRGGQFLQDKMPYEYQGQKLSLKIDQFAEGLPKVFIDFYNYVISLNCQDQINFFYWKAHLTRVLTQEVVSQPYRFLLVKDRGCRHLTTYSKSKYSEYDDEISDMMEICEEDYLQLGKNIQKVTRIMPNRLRFKNEQF